MPDQYYDSKLTGEQLDAAFLQVQNIQQTASQVQSNATAAAQSASQASQSASSASRSASQASTSAQSASESQSAAASSASSASESAKDAAASASSIEGDVEQAAASANAASQSATQAASSASAAAASATAAADSEDEVQANAAVAQQAAASASASEGNARASETAAASSAETATGAASAAQTSETNAAESARQAAASVASIGDDVATSAANAQAAQQAAAQAAASASAAEDAAERAEQIADFNPADFATAAQGTKADTAVQSVNSKTGTAITLGAADVGAATAAQGSLAETAVQPDALDAFALKTDVPDTPADIGAATAAQGAKADTAVQSVNGAKPDSSGNVQLDLTTGTVRSVNGKDPDGSGNVQLSAGDVGAATAAQGAKADTALQPGALTGYAQTSDIPSKLPNPQSLGIRLGQYGSTTYYDGGAAKTITITPEAIGAQPAGASSGGELTLLYNNKSVTTLNPGEMIRFNAAGYDAIGIVSRHRASDDFYSPMQIVEFNNEPYTTCMLYAVGMDSRYGPEISAREVSVASGSIVAQDRGYYYNWSAHEADDGACIPVQVWGIKF